MARILLSRDCVLNGGDTGVGKTYEMCQLAAELDMPMFVVAPKATIDIWFETAELMGAVIIGVTNYESAKNGKYYRVCNEYVTETRIECEYVRKVTVDGAVEFHWSLPIGTLLIFDEAHRGKNASTDTSKLMEHAADQPGCKIAILSATITDSIKCFKTAAYLLGLAQRGKHAYNAWLRSLRKPGERRTDAQLLHHCVYVNEETKCGVRTRIRDLQEDRDAIVRQLFLGNTVVAQTFQMSPEVEAEIEAAYAAIAAALEDLKTKQQGEQHPLTIVLRARQRIEMLRVPQFVMLTMQEIDRGRSVIIFAHFNETMTRLFEQLDPFIQTERGSFITFVNGAQTPEDRKYNIRAFREDKSRIMLCNVGAGSVGISLNDVNGNYPRTAFHPPCWSSIQLKQCIGRAHRAGSKSDTLQIIVYCKGRASVVPMKLQPGVMAAVVDDRAKAEMEKMENDLGNDTTFKSSEGRGRVGVEELMAEHVNRKLTTLEWLNNGDDNDLLLL